MKKTFVSVVPVHPGIESFKILVGQSPGDRPTRITRLFHETYALNHHRSAALAPSGFQFPATFS